MFLNLSEAPQGLILTYPSWISLLFGVAALAAAYALVWRPDGPTKRRIGGCFAASFLSVAALYFGTYTARFDDTGASLRAFARYDLSVSWQNVRGIRLERARNRGQVGHVLMIATASGELEFNISDLDDAGLGRLIPFVDKQIDSSR